MAPFYLCLCLCAVLSFLATDFPSNALEVPFDQNYVPDWGVDHVAVLERGRQVQIRIDPNSGGGFRSRNPYGSGYFRISLKIPKNAKGIATTFYLISSPESAIKGNHDELDFELLDNNGYTLNTNVFAQDSGNREQQFKLWFDPTLNFHDYEILWNQHQIVFFVDKIPIRVFKNNRNIGARYPKLPMYIHASLWNASLWLGPKDWSKGPFLATYQGFEILGCPYDSSNPTKCESPIYDWNAPKNWQLNPQQQKLYEVVKRKFMTYDYCKSSSRNNFPECRIST